MDLSACRVDLNSTPLAWPSMYAPGKVFVPGSREPLIVRAGDTLIVRVEFGEHPIATIRYSVDRA